MANNDNPKARYKLVAPESLGGKDYVAGDTVWLTKFGAEYFKNKGSIDMRAKHEPPIPKKRGRKPKNQDEH